VAFDTAKLHNAVALPTPAGTAKSAILAKSITQKLQREGLSLSLKANAAV
jgi:hypothetical protein